MAQYICPSCGSKYFMTSKIGRKNVFQVSSGRTVEVVQQGADANHDAVLDTTKIYCGACSWQGILDEVIESERE